LEEQSLPALNVLDLELFYHYTHDTNLTVFSNATLYKIWTTDVVVDSFQHPFLLHMILAVSALHLAHTGSPERRELYRVAAAQHQQQGLRQFTPMINHITTRNCDALFSCATFIVMFAAAMPQSPGMDIQAETFEKLFCLAQLTKGVFSIIEGAGEWIRSGKLGQIFDGDRWDETQVTPLSNDTVTAFESIDQLINAEGNDHNRAVHAEAMMWLRKTLNAVHKNIDHPSIGFMFLIFTPPSFMELLRQKDQLALVILAHWAIILHGSRHLWYIKNWGLHLLEASYQELQPEWRKCITWPMQQLRKTQTADRESNADPEFAKGNHERPAQNIGFA